MSITEPKDMLPETIGAFRGGEFHFFDLAEQGFSRRYEDGSPVYADVYVYPTPSTTFGCRGECAAEVVAQEVASFVKYTIPMMLDSAYYDAVEVLKDTTLSLTTGGDTVTVFELTLSLTSGERELLSYFILVPWKGNTLKIRLTGPAQHVAWPDPILLVRQLLDTATPAFQCSLGPTDDDPVVLSTEASGRISGARVADAVDRALAARGYRIRIKDSSSGVWVTEAESRVRSGRSNRYLAVPTGLQVTVMVKPGILAQLHIQAESLCKIREDEWHDEFESGKATVPATAALILVQEIEKQLGR